MFKLFDKQEKNGHFLELIQKEDYTSIIEKMDEGHLMTLEEKTIFNKNIENKVQYEGIVFLSDLYKEGFEITDQWLLRWAKSRKFVTNYNIPVYGAEYFKERLENIAPDILSFYLYRMDNLSMGISRSYKVCYMQAVEVYSSVRNYSTIIDHIQTGISDKNLNEYYYKLKNLNTIVEDSASFYSHFDTKTKVSDYVKDLEKIIVKREKEKKIAVKPVIPEVEDFTIPHNIQDCIKRIYDNHGKCIDNQQYLKPSTVMLLNNIKEDKVDKLIQKFKEDDDKDFFVNALKKIDDVIASVLLGINRNKMTEASKQYLTGRHRKKF